MTTAIEAAKARAKELQDANPPVPSRDLSNVDLDQLDPATVTPAVVDLSQAPSQVAQTGFITPNFGELTGGALNVPHVPQATQKLGDGQVMTNLRAAVEEEKLEDAAVDGHRNFKTFRHMFAGANVIMADGTRLTFGGNPGNNGYYSTDNSDEVAYLRAMCRSASSQVSEEANHFSPELASLRARAAEDARRNTLLETDPNITAARNNLGRTIAANGSSN